MRPQWRSAVAISASLAGLCAMATPARADVLAIADDGSVTAYRGAMVYTDVGATAVVAPRARPSPRSDDVGAIRSAIAQAADRYAVSRELVEAVAWQESRLQHRAVSPKGALGVMQLMPATARELSVDPLDLAQNISGGAAYLAQLLRRYDGDLRLSLAAYNAGPAAVDRYRGVPPFAETQRYVSAILTRLGQTPR
ncbi:lytic transglycosylase domain-containing protein [Phenylobacterium sp. LjRoot225]|uniref:lytic transglycosylase domain-containing protein n=1 Tax=Phenylobacterium sp. LjRoot225 TaxID=3342285 RepID=UPI003ED0B8B6